MGFIDYGGTPPRGITKTKPCRKCKKIIPLLNYRFFNGKCSDCFVVMTKHGTQKEKIL